LTKKVDPALSSLVTSSPISLILSALLLSLGTAIGGHFIGEGISNRNVGRRIISVKGLSEKEVPASVATWTIGYIATGNDLETINKKLGDSTKAAVAFLKERGFDEKDLAVQPPFIHDTKPRMGIANCGGGLRPGIGTIFGGHRPPLQPDGISHALHHFMRDCVRASSASLQDIVNVIFVA
jgi:hypothetical protein